MSNADTITETQDQHDLTNRSRAYALSIISESLQDAQTHSPLSIAQILEHARPTLGGAVPVGLYRTVRLLAFREALGDKIASSLLRISGKSVAMKMGITAAQDILDILESMSIGRLKVEEQSSGLMIISAEECATCSGLPNVNTPLCCFEGGFIAGGLEKITGHRYQATETHCWGLGDTICRWQVTSMDANTASGCESMEPIDVIMALVDKAASSVDTALAIRDKNLQLREAERKTQESNRLKKDLTDMMVHDMRVPLTAVVGSLEMMADMMGAGLSPQESKLMKIALSSSQMLINMVSDLQDISRIEGRKLNLTIAPVSPDSIILQALSSTEIRARKKRLRVDVEIPNSLPNISADRERLTRVLINLVSNAIRYTPSGGKVTVTAAMDRSGHSIRISVADTGEGIPMEFHDRIFDKFFQIEPNRAKRKDSSGIGLAYCKMMTEAHGGEISVESKPGQGSTFSITLPVIKF